jgi:hypothetical protein
MGLFTSRWPFIQTNSSRLEVQFNIQLQMQPGLTLGRFPALPHRSNCFPSLNHKFKLQRDGLSAGAVTIKVLPSPQLKTSSF